jgi:hypothetical protein
MFSREGYEVVMRGAAASRDPGLSAFFLKELRTRLPERVRMPMVRWLATEPLEDCCC